MTLDRPDLSRKLVLAPRPRKLPDVLSIEEVAGLLEAAPGTGHHVLRGAGGAHTPPAQRVRAYTSFASNAAICIHDAGQSVDGANWM